MLHKCWIRKTLKWELDPVQNNYCMELPPSVKPTVEKPRKPPVVRNIKEDEMPQFRRDDRINVFSDISETLCPPGYTLDLKEHVAIFYRLEIKDNPEVTESIIVDDR